MPTTRKVLRVFLASPGDLQDERKAIRDVVIEFNESWADELGYQVELLGWEETVAGFGRPQYLINQELDQCDLFIGMIWKRWGTPPGSNNQYTSGFQEEFERSLARREKSERPEISLFFKNIPDEFMVDPGNDLIKVLQFKEQIIREKKILFQVFSDVKDMEGLARKSITKFVNTVKAKDEVSGSDDNRVRHNEAKSEAAQNERVSPADSPLSAEGLEFLEKLVDRFSQERAIDDLNSSDIARFRLLANSISKPGNEDLNLGVHDANIIFSAYAKGMNLGKREIRCLTKLGFRYLTDEIVPIWCWYSATSSWQFDEAFASSLIGSSDEEKIGAIRVLDSLSRDLPTDDEPIMKEWLMETWFSDESSSLVRSAALGYLAKKGTAEEYSIAKKEYDRSEHGTILPALDCMLQILLRTGQENSAQQLALKSQFKSLNADTLQEIINGFDNLETEKLLLGLEHGHAQVRLRTLEVLLGRDALDSTMIEKLIEDSHALVRNEAVMALIKLGRSFNEEEIKTILLQPQNQVSNIGKTIASYADMTGENLYARYKLEQLKNLPEPVLTEKVNVSLIYDDAAYFARVENYFSKYADELRRDIDNTFSTYFEERVRRTRTFFKNIPDSETVVISHRDLEDFIRKKLTRQGLDILCAKGNNEDIMRIRGNLQSGFAGTSIADTEYLRKRGEWTDIPLLANRDAPSVSRAFGLADYMDFEDKVAKALLGMGRNHSIPSLFSLEVPDTILKKTIEHCPVLRFSEISDEELLKLFNHESADIRKAASIMAVRALSKKRIKSLLNEYIFSDKYRYYNVIHWLDLGASMTRNEARKVALAFSD